MEVRITPLVLLWAISTTIAHADDSAVSTHGVLHSPNHPQSSDYTSVYPDTLTPVDDKISWVNRFRGDARFNTPERVESESSATDQSVGDRMAVTGFDARGIVKKIDPIAQKVKLAHGPIKRMGMPAMTMMFKTSDASLLSMIKVGQEVDFNVAESDEGFVVTSFAPLDASDAQSAGDARGVVKSIRNGKIKLQHGPIEKYGMPGMTMMFKTTDPTMLDGLSLGAEVEFDVDSTDSGFTITRIKKVKEAEQ